MENQNLAQTGITAGTLKIFIEIGEYAENNFGMIVLSKIYRPQNQTGEQISVSRATRVLKTLIEMGLIERYTFGHYRLTKEGGELYMTVKKKVAKAPVKAAKPAVKKAPVKKAAVKAKKK